MKCRFFKASLAAYVGYYCATKQCVNTNITWSSNYKQYMGAIDKGSQYLDFVYKITKKLFHSAEEIILVILITALGD